MRILMTDGSGLTARQTANRLWSAGHFVEALAPDPLCLCRFTRHVHRIRRVPAYGPDPLAWLDAALTIYDSGHFDVLFPTQEQVAVLASAPDRLHDSGVATAVPPFSALAAVQEPPSMAPVLAEPSIFAGSSTTTSERRPARWSVLDHLQRAFEWRDRFAGGDSGAWRRLPREAGVTPC
jgi:hypothetical protein